ncbi:MAG: hypothetical protein ABIV51_09520 [Saprospiraceae bacterium]
MRKYRIEEILNKRSIADKRQAIDDICKLLHIGRNRLVRIRYAGDGNYNTSASADQLKVIAEYLQVKVDDLFTDVKQLTHE